MRNRGNIEQDQVEKREEVFCSFGVSLWGRCSLSQVENESGRQGGGKDYDTVTFKF